jgi:hypothetical protein
MTFYCKVKMQTAGRRMIVSKKYVFITSLILLLAPILLPRNAAGADVVFNRVVVDNGGLSNIWLKTFGDLNGDGQLDLVAGANGSGGLVWYQSPNWTKRTIASGGSFSTDGEVADVDRDGDQDVIALTSGEIRWYENPNWTVHVIESRALHDVEVADFDRDGDVDLVGRGQTEFGDTGHQLHFYRQDSPTSWTRRSVSCAEGEGLKVVDVDRDGDQDVVVNSSWFENSGNIVSGTWTAYSFTSTWTHPNAYIGTGDINRDGRVDIVLAPAELEGQTYRISWFEAPASPKSGNWTERIVENNVEAVHHFVGVADLDSDGDLDVAAAEMQQGGDPDEVKVYLNQNGTGGSWVKQVLASTGSHSMRILDVGNDGDQDLFGGNWQGNQVELWVNQTNPTSAPTNTPTKTPTSIPTNTPTLPPESGGISLTSWGRQVIDSNKGNRTVFVLPGDLDSDGDQDVVSGGAWYRNPGSLSGTWTKTTIGSPLNEVALVHDLDGDGDLDLFGTQGVGSSSNSNFAWAQNNGAGSFTIRTNIPAGEGDFLQGGAVGNFGGGTLEIALSWHEAGQGIQVLTVPSNPASTQWSLRKLNNSSGQPVASQDEGLSAGDIDRDGDIDILTGTKWLQRNGSSWTERTLFNTTSFPDRNELADINKDGRLDAVVGYEAISTNGKLAWYEQPTTATNLWTERLIAQVVGPMSLDVADMDRDGDQDVIVGEHNLDNPDSARLLVFENTNGVGGTWTQRVVYTGDEHHDGAQTADFDRDGDLDIVSIGWENPRMAIYHNKSGASSSPTATSTPTNTPTAIPSNTATSTATNTPTNIPPNTATATPTNTPTNPSNPPTHTATTTQVPTNVPANTATATQTSTATATATSTSTSLPTATPTATAMPTATSVEQLPTQNWILPPVSWLTFLGTTSGSFDTLGKLEQTESADDPSKYVTFQPRRIWYLGYMTFSLPKEIPTDTITNVSLQVNFKGTASTRQAWSWSIYDWRTRRWVRLGQVIVGKSETDWQMLEFQVQNPTRYLSSRNEIRILLRSNNGRGDAKIDYEVIQVTYGTDASVTEKILPTATATQTPTAITNPTNADVVPAATETPTVEISPTSMEEVPVATDAPAETPTPTISP